ncbi:MAG: glycosyltransferase family 25 protein [Gammaproteobacteria bacterium]
MAARAVCINLDTSPKRWREFREQLTPPVLASLGPVERVSAYSPETLPVPMPERFGLTSASWACYQSHLREIERAIEDRVDELVIFEDDAVFDRRFVAEYPQFRAAVPAGWDVLYFGGRHKRKPYEIAAGYVQCRDVVLQHAWALSGSGLPKVRDHLRDLDGLMALEGRKRNKDQWCGEGIALRKFAAYAPRAHWLVHQRCGRSDRNGALHPARYGVCRTKQAVEWPPV